MDRLNVGRVWFVCFREVSLSKKCADFEANPRTQSINQPWITWECADFDSKSSHSINQCNHRIGMGVAQTEANPRTQSINQPWITWECADFEANPRTQSINQPWITWECADFEANTRTQSINQPSNSMGVCRLWGKTGGAQTLRLILVHTPRQPQWPSIILALFGSANTTMDIVDTEVFQCDNFRRISKNDSITLYVSVQIEWWVCTTTGSRRKD